jgi:hypothetical protein
MQGSDLAGTELRAAARPARIPAAKVWNCFASTALIFKTTPPHQSNPAAFLVLKCDGNEKRLTFFVS